MTAEDLQAAARKYLDRGRLLTTAMLPAEYVGGQGLPKAEDLLRPGRADHAAGAGRSRPRRSSRSNWTTAPSC